MIFELNKLSYPLVPPCPYIDLLEFLDPGLFLILVLIELFLASFLGWTTLIFSSMVRKGYKVVKHDVQHIV